MIPTYLAAAIAVASLGAVARLWQENRRLRLALLEEKHVSDWRQKLLDKKGWRDAGEEKPRGPRGQEPPRHG